ncbi:MAG: hypothetical protein HON78_02545 [Legionellales bacterium]|nr:hypothetical protein [Legionellales bacterium]
MDCDVAALLAMTFLGDNFTSAVHAMMSWVARFVEITGMAGLRRRCAPRNDGGVAVIC